MTRMKWLEELLETYPDQNIVLLENQSLKKWHIRGERKLLELQALGSYKETSISEFRFWHDCPNYNCYFGVEGEHKANDRRALAQYNYGDIPITWFNPPEE